MKPGELAVRLESYLAIQQTLGFPLKARKRLLFFRKFCRSAERTRAHYGTDCSRLGLCRVGSLRGNRPSWSPERGAAVLVAFECSGAWNGGTRRGPTGSGASPKALPILICRDPNIVDGSGKTRADRLAPAAHHADHPGTTGEYRPSGGRSRAVAGE